MKTRKLIGKRSDRAIGRKAAAAQGGSVNIIE